jgi:Ca2+-binding RTX toxin-like protein
MTKIIKGSNWKDVLVGGDIDEDIYGWGGDDVINGGGGNDWIEGQAGRDTIDGGAGNDWAGYTSSSTGVLVSLETGQGFGGDADGDTLTNIENLSGSNYSDILTGNGESNIITGRDGNDTLMGRAGADWLLGGIGNDTLNGGTGADDLNGGDGTDTASYKDAAGSVVVSLITGLGSYGEADGDHLYFIENLTGSKHGDWLVGNDAANVLNSGDGMDTLSGMGGNDTIHGGDDADSISGGAGRDVLYGEAGADKFVWGTLADTGTTAATIDVLADFNAMQGDKISVGGFDANVDAAGWQDFTFVAGQDFSGAGQVRFYTDQGNTFLAFNTDADMSAEGIIRVNGIHNVDASWFQF